MDKKLSHCSKCKSIFYCSRDCQKTDWADHKKQCRLISSSLLDPSNNALDQNVEIYEHQNARKEKRDRQERLRLGTSAYDPTRQDPAANELNRQGLAAKRAGRIEEAIQLYSQAIRLNPFDHDFFHNRSAAYKILDNYDMVLLDAQRTLELDSSFPLSWCNVIEGYYYTMRFDAAQKAAVIAPQYVDRNHDLYHFLPGQIKWLEEQLANPRDYPFEVRPVMDDGDSLAFVYTNGLFLRNQQDLLIVDLPARALSLLQKKLLNGLFQSGQYKPGQRLALGDTFRVKGYKLVAIPVDNDQQRVTIQKALMGGGTREDQGVALIKVFGKSHKGPVVLTEAQAQEYVDSVVAHAPACQQRYNHGLRLVEDDDTHKGL